MELGIVAFFVSTFHRRALPAHEHSGEAPRVFPLPRARHDLRRARHGGLLRARCDGRDVDRASCRFETRTRRRRSALNQACTKFESREGTEQAHDAVFERRDATPTTRGTFRASSRRRRRARSPRWRLDLDHGLTTGTGPPSRSRSARRRSAWSASRSRGCSAWMPSAMAKPAAHRPVLRAVGDFDARSRIGKSDAHRTCRRVVKVVAPGSRRGTPRTRRRRAARKRLRRAPGRTREITEGSSVPRAPPRGVRALEQLASDRARPLGRCAYEFGEGLTHERPVRSKSSPASPVLHRDDLELDRHLLVTIREEAVRSSPIVMPWRIGSAWWFTKAFRGSRHEDRALRRRRAVDRVRAIEDDEAQIPRSAATFIARFIVGGVRVEAHADVLQIEDERVDSVERSSTSRRQALSVEAVAPARRRTRRCRRSCPSRSPRQPVLRREDRLERDAGRATRSASIVDVPSFVFALALVTSPTCARLRSGARRTRRGARRCPVFTSVAALTGDVAISATSEVDRALAVGMDAVRSGRSTNRSRSGSIHIAVPV